MDGERRRKPGRMSAPGVPVAEVDGIEDVEMDWAQDDGMLAALFESARAFAIRQRPEVEAPVFEYFLELGEWPKEDPPHGRAAATPSCLFDRRGVTDQIRGGMSEIRRKPPGRPPPAELPRAESAGGKRQAARSPAVVEAFRELLCDLPDRAGRSPADYAALMDRADLLKVRNQRNETLLDCAVRSGSVECMRLALRGVAGKGNAILTRVVTDGQLDLLPHLVFVHQ
jgi:hypothetical protein